MYINQKTQLTGIIFGISKTVKVKENYFERKGYF